MTKGCGIPAWRLGKIRAAAVSTRRGPPHRAALINLDSINRQHQLQGQDSHHASFSIVRRHRTLAHGRHPWQE
jgi:hypothetical protein